MSTQITGTSVHASIVVDAPIERAFQVFTQDFGKFKPAEHNMLGVEIDHRNLDRHGEGWEGVRDGVGGDQGWPLYLSRYATVAEGTN